MSEIKKPPPTGSNTRLHTQHPSLGEIVVATKSPNRNKAAGLDQVNAEMLKACPLASASALQSLFVQIWREEKIPDDCLEAVLVIVSKKSDLTKCRSYRGIMFLSIASKVLLSHINVKLDTTIRK